MNNDELRALRIGRWCYDPHEQTLTFDAAGRDLLGISGETLSLDEWTDRYPQYEWNEILESDARGIASEIMLSFTGAESAFCLTVLPALHPESPTTGYIQDISRFARLSPLVPVPVLSRSEFVERGQQIFQAGRRFSLLAIDAAPARASGLNDREQTEWIVRRLRQSIRRDDIIAQLAGQEFALLLMDAGPEAARRIAQRLSGEERIHPVGGGAGSFSIGYTVVSRDDMTFRDVLERADQALYIARGGGEDPVYY
ncbi:MAG: diguanylate cyclase [Clostridiales bacterium]|nr:diguanylate cyclase [Clostridiales bacterium]